MRMRSKQLLNSLKGVTIPRLTHNAIALLSPQDSTLITGGVSNESGLFVIIIYI